MDLNITIATETYINANPTETGINHPLNHPTVTDSSAPGFITLALLSRTTMMASEDLGYSSALATET
jgi:hypothetical protein